MAVPARSVQIGLDPNSSCTAGGLPFLQFASPLQIWSFSVSTLVRFLWVRPPDLVGFVASLVGHALSWWFSMHNGFAWVFFWCFYGWLSLSLDIEVAFLDYIAAVFSGVCFRFACDLLWEFVSLPAYAPVNIFLAIWVCRFISQKKKKNLADLWPH